MLEKSADFFVSFFGQSDFCARNGISTLLRRILSATDFSQNLTERNKAMNITDIRIRKIYSENRLRALVSITVDHDLAVHDIKIIEGSERLFVAMPSRREFSGYFPSYSPSGKASVGNCGAKRLSGLSFTNRRAAYRRTLLLFSRPANTALGTRSAKCPRYYLSAINIAKSPDRVENRSGL